MNKRFEFSVAVAFLFAGAISLTRSISTPSGSQMILASDFSSGYSITSDLTDDGNSASDFASGKFNGSVSRVRLLEDRSVLLAGEFTRYDQLSAGHFIKIDPAGQPDMDFLNRLGTGFDNSVSDFHVQSDGKIVAVGAFQTVNGRPAPWITRLNPDGTMDDSFASELQLDSAPLAVRVLASGTILVGGAFNGFLATLSPSGKRIR